MNKVTRIQAVPLAIGLQQILLSKFKKTEEAFIPVEYFEQLIIETKKVSREEAAKVTEAVISTGILRWDMSNNNFIL